MTILILFFAAFTATGICIGRLYERQVVSIRRADTAENDRVTRPWVTVTDGGPVDSRDHSALVAELDDPPGRHGFGRAKGTSAQMAAWAADTKEWPAVRRLFMDDRAELEAVAT